MKKRLVNNQKGMAMIEAVPLLIIFAVMLAFMLGMFGIVHTAVLSSISARAYAFETFRSRSNLNYYREDGSALDGTIGPLYLGRKEFRYHAIQHESDQRPRFIATTRNVAIGLVEPTQASADDLHNTQIYSILDKVRNQKTSSNPVWIMVGYGICLKASCGE